MRLSQAGQLIRLPQEGTGEADDSVLLCGVDARRCQQGGQVKGVNIQGDEL